MTPAKASVDGSPSPLAAASWEELHASEQCFHHLVDAVTDYAIFLLDATGRVATWNAGAEKTKGYTADEIVGCDFSIFYTPEDRAAGKPARILDTVRREGRCEDESWRMRKDGSRFWANVVITALRNPQGGIRGFAKVTRDLTQRRAAEDNERTLAVAQLGRVAAEKERIQLLTLLEQVPAAINFFRGPALVVEFAHPRAIGALGGREALGKPLFEAAPEYRKGPYFADLKRVYDTGESFTQREALAPATAAGPRAETYVDSVYLPVRDGSGAIEGVMTFEIDVTESVVARREMETITRESTLARQELERLNRAKDEFLATMSHELRTPLNAVLGWATILRKSPRSEADLDRGLEIIQRNATTQARLVSDLLDVSRVISGKLQLAIRRTDLFAVIQAAVDVVSPAAEGKGVRLVVDVDPDIGATVADPDRLQQVMWNLLTNAIRFTPRGGRVTVTGKRTSCDFFVSVEDTGSGIAAEHLPVVFERFRQIDASLSTRAHGGLGLGLAIVRHLVEAHGGSVEARSAGVGRGATFIVLLPIRAVAPSQEEPAAEAEAPGSHAGEGASAGIPPTSNESLRNVRVLVVDDNRDSLEVLQAVLERAGAHVTSFTSAFEALAAPGRFDVVVSDIGMPGMDGYAFIRRIRARDRDADVPAIALTAYARAEDADRAMRAGYQEHFAKPVVEGRLVQAVKACAQSRSERR